MNRQTPLTLALSQKERELDFWAPFSLGRRVGDEGNSDLNSAMPISFCRIFTARAAHCSIDNAAIMVDSVESCLATSPKFVLKRHILPKIPSMTW
jgi:hypothetical protein